MELNSFARIGKGVISKAIGLQSNYSQVVVNGPNVLDEVASGCYSCTCYTQHQFITNTMSDSLPCDNCPQAVYKPSQKVKTVYINERNRYGYQPTLKNTAIRLLLLYHFLQPDVNGFVKNVMVKDLAAKIGCTPATIHACNKTLQQYGYCYFSSYNNYISVLLPEYKDYHKTAAEGGRGYITMSVYMFSKILDIKHINPLRLNLKGILEVDNARISGSDTAYVVSPFKKLRRFLPRYCKNNVIRTALQSSSAILDTSFSDKDVIFKIKDAFSQKKIREELLANNQQNIVNYVDNMNDSLEKCKDAFLRSDLEEFDLLKSHLMGQGIVLSKDMPFISLRLADYADLAALSIQYNIHMVVDAIRQIYNSYISKGIPIDSFGALARTFIRNNASFQLVA